MGSHRCPGSTDEQVLARAEAERRVLVTADKDFGELAFRSRLPAASGIILLRLRGAPASRTAALLAAIEDRDDWANQFAVIENDRIPHDAAAARRVGANHARGCEAARASS